MQTIAILGSTGSIGTQTLDILDRFPDRLRVAALAGRRVDLLRAQAARYRPSVVCLADPMATQDDCAGFPDGCTVLRGADAMEQIAADPGIDRVVVATVGGAGLRATLAAAEAGQTILLANKEVLVSAGALVTSVVQHKGARLFPIDSEHSALWQCLAGEEPDTVASLILTASGGALRQRPLSDLPAVTPEEALRHPTWQMGRKVTIDSATLMNKGMEVIEARWLFGIEYDRISVVLHAQSIVHSLVAFRDGSIKAQLGLTDMRLPIQYALSYPARWERPEAFCDVAALGRLDFGPPDLSRYPCLTLALQAARQGGAAPAVLAGADDAAVDLFLAGRIRLTDIASLLKEALSAYTESTIDNLEAVLAAEHAGRAAVLAAAQHIIPPPWGQRG